MKRFKEKTDAAVAYASDITSEHPGLVYLDFLAGVDWADETMINKACEWLEREMNNYISFDGEIDKEFIADFKKAMEE